MSRTIAAGNTATFTYTPDTAPDALPTVACYDAAGDVVELANTPVDVSEDGDFTSVIVTLEASETEDLLGECKLVWTWAYTDDYATNTVRDVEVFTVAEAVSSSVTLTVGTNTYVTLAEAEDYLAERLGVAAWDAADTGDRSRALKAAARAIDSMSLRGRRVDDEQAMEFPRAYWESFDRPRFTEEHERWSASIVGAGYTYDEEVPQRVKDAQCEEALALLDAQAQTIDRRVLQQQGVTSVRIGDFQESYSVSTGVASVGSTVTGRLRSVEALALLRPYLAKTVSIR